MTNQELIVWSLRFTASNVDEEMVSEAKYNSYDHECTEEELDEFERQLRKLAKIVQEDWISLMEIVGEVARHTWTRIEIGEIMDISDEEMKRLINLARMLQEE